MIQCLIASQSSGLITSISFADDALWLLNEMNFICWIHKGIINEFINYLQLHIFPNPTRSKFRRKVPTEIVDARAKYEQDMTKANADAVDNGFMRQSDSRMPLFQEKKSTVSFGKGS